MVDQLGAVLGKYEVPMGLMNKCKFFWGDVLCRVDFSVFCFNASCHIMFSHPQCYPFDDIVDQYNNSNDVIRISIP